MSSKLRRTIRHYLAFTKGMWSMLTAIPRGLEGFQTRLVETQNRLDDHLKQLDKGEQTLLYQTVGNAITSWAKLEEAVVTIFALLLRNDSRTAGLILYSIINFNTWLSIIHDLFEMDEALTPFQHRWNKLAERMRKIKDQRDQIAHHALDTKTTALKASRFDVRRKSVLQRPMGAMEAVEFTQAVTAITESVLELADEMIDALRTSTEKSGTPNSGR